MTFRYRHGHFPGWQGMGFWGSRGRLFGPGEMRLALLSLLAENPRHGYDLMKQLENRSGGFYRASAGTIYPTLQQLEDEGLVSSEPLEGKRIYRLTEEGKKEVEREGAAIRRIWRRAETWEDWRSAMHPDAGEIRSPAERLLKAAFRVAGCGGYSQRHIERVRAILERALKDLEELAAEE